MKGTLGLEYIGATVYDSLRAFDKVLGVVTPKDFPGPRVCRVKRDEDGEVRFEHVYGKRDYSRANSKGTRGIYLWYTLEEAELYLVKAPLSWRSVDIYYATVRPDGGIYRLSKDQVAEWLRSL